MISQYQYQPVPCWASINNTYKRLIREFNKASLHVVIKKFGFRFILYDPKFWYQQQPFTNLMYIDAPLRSKWGFVQKIIIAFI